MVSSINTNIAAFYAQANIANASNQVSLSVARLSSGNRIVQAAEDVAALSIGTSLRTGVSTLKVALTNASQGATLLQVADGALAQITEILQRQKAIALQAGSGTLTDGDRTFLNQEFQALSAEIDRLAGATNFNGVKLINGALSTSTTVGNTSTNADQGVLNINFSNNITNGESVVIGGVALIAGGSGTTGFALGGTLTETIQNLAAKLEELSSNPTYSSALGKATYSVDNGETGTTLIIKARAGGTLGNSFNVSSGGPSYDLAALAITTGASTAAGVATLVVDLGTGITPDFIVGQYVNLSGQAAAIDGVTAAQINTRLQIIAVSGTTITLQTAGTATAGGTNGGTANVGVTLDTASYGVEGAVNGGFGGGSSFNLFGTTTGLTAATQVVAASTSTSAIPFKNGDTITATVEGITKTLYTVATGATLKDVVDGINASSDSTGFRAALVYSAGTYNIRLDYDSLQSNVVVNLGTNYNATTYNLAGDSVDSSGIIDGAAAAAQNQAIFYTGYIDLLAASIGAVTLSANVVGTSASVATTPFQVGSDITVTINGVQHTLHTFVAADGFDDIIASINAKTATTGVYAAITGTSGDVNNIRLFLTQQNSNLDLVRVSTGTVNNSAGDASTATQATITGAALTQVRDYGLKGGINNGLGAGSVSVTGNIGDNILTTLAQTKASVSVLLTANALLNDTVTVGGKLFSFTNNTTNKAPDEITIGATIGETLDNAVSTINRYLSDGFATGSTAYQLNQLNITRSGQSLVFTGRSLSNVTTLSGTGATIAQSITGASITNSGNLNNASSTFGVDVSGITNSAFNGTIGGFSATYTNVADTVNLSVKIGNFTYTAQNVDATVTTDTVIRLYSDTVDGKSGGYFDIQLRGGQVAAFSSQAGANNVANSLNAAFSSLSFIQNRNISSYNGTQSISANSTVIGSLLGSRVTAQFSDYTNVRLSNVQVIAPSGSNVDARITLTINGVEYSTSSGLGSKLGANQSYRLVSSEDPNQFVEFTTGNSTIDLSSTANAAAVAQALKDAFGISAGSAALSFQVGATAADTLSVSIGDATTSSLYAGVVLNVSSQTNAAAASAALDAALSTLTSLRANVGALQSRFNFAANSIQSSLQNQEAARSLLLDTDIAVESTNYATNQVKLQAGISVLAQANQQLQALLKLIG